MRRAGRAAVTGKAMRLGMLFAFLTGCAQKPVVPTEPGTSAELAYPVLVAGERRVLVKDDEASLTTTTAASGINFLVTTLIDSKGARYSVRAVTDFGRKSAFLDMGTTPYRVFLDMKPEGTATLAQARGLVLEQEPEAQASLRNVGSLAELIEACRNRWEWPAQ